MTGRAMRRLAQPTLHSERLRTHVRMIGPAFFHRPFISLRVLPSSLAFASEFRAHLPVACSPGVRTYAGRKQGWWCDTPYVI